MNFYTLLPRLPTLQSFWYLQAISVYDSLTFCSSLWIEWCFLLRVCFSVMLVVGVYVVVLLNLILKKNTFFFVRCFVARTTRNTVRLTAQTCKNEMKNNVQHKISKKTIAKCIKLILFKLIEENGRKTESSKQLKQKKNDAKNSLRF